MTRGILFSDVDGTLVHYADTTDKLGRIEGASPDGRGHTFVTNEGQSHTILKLPPSKTGMQGIISLRTLELFADVRRAGHKVVIISGARTSTVLQRLPFLPAADAVVTENGGRIFLRDPKMLATAPLVEDAAWRETHAAGAGPGAQEGVPPEKREAPLWEVYRVFADGGWNPDADSYTMSFRVKVKAPHTVEELEERLAELPAELTYSFNLGMADVYPKTSGKDKAAEYIMAKWGAPAADCALLCDDDNDLLLARAVGRAYLPGVSAATMKAATESDPERFFVAPSHGTVGTELALQKFMSDAGGACRGPCVMQ